MSATLTAQLQDVLPAEALGTFEGREGVPTCPLAAPASIEEWAELMRFASAERVRLLPIGNGTKLSWCYPPTAVDLVVSTRRWSGVVAYEPADGTLTARTGTTWAELRSTVHEGGHRLTPDLPNAEHATLGGALGAGESGWDRLRFGPLRHHVLGTRVLDGDGQVTKSGGRLVKNVTGYDVHRLHVGGHGTLGILLEASMRLFPRAHEHAALRVRCKGRAEALERARTLLDPTLRPVALCAHDLEDGWQVEITFAGGPERVDWEVERAIECVGSEGVTTTRGSEADAVFEHARERERWQGRWPTLRVGATRTELDSCLERVEAAVRELDRPARVLAHPGVATASVWIDGNDADPQPWLRLAERLASAGLHPTWPNAPRSARTELELFGPASAGLELMRRLRSNLDPHGIFAAGRFHGRL